MVLLSFLEGSSFDDIQKYNGKGVKVESLVNLFFNSNQVLLFLRISSMSAHHYFRLRSLLKTRGISLRKIKKKDALIGIRFCISEGLLNGDFIDFWQKLLDLSLFSFVFDDFDHFLYFQNILSGKLLKDGFFPFFVKINNQYFLLDSDNYLLLTRKMVNFNYDLNLIKSSFLLNTFVYHNFFLFILYFHIQKNIFSIT